MRREKENLLSSVRGGRWKRSVCYFGFALPACELQGDAQAQCIEHEKTRKMPSSLRGKRWKCFCCFG